MPTTLILGGYIPTPNSEPMTLSIQRSSGHFCGGTLIKPNKSLTAAHCYTRRSSPSEYTLVAGAHHLTHNEANQQRRVATSFRTHEAYNKDTMINDIALVTHSSFQINDFVAIIPLPARRDKEWMKEGTKLKMCGWGETKFPGEGMADALHCVEIEYILTKECNKRTHYNGNIREGMFCAASSGKDSCNGDNGGGATNVYEVLGVKSWGYGCGQASYPGKTFSRFYDDKYTVEGVYTDVAIFREWLDHNINKD